jgi:adp-heptose synthase protein
MLNIPVLIDPKGNDYKKYKGATVITPNKNELRAVVGEWSDETDLRVKAQNLRTDLQLEKLLLTRSEEGMTLFGENEIIDIPTNAREVYDVSGAGDTAIATLALMLSNGKSWKEAVMMANKAAGIVVGRFGTVAITASELQL